MASNSRVSLSCGLVLATVFLLSYAPGSATAARSLLQISTAQQFVVPQSHLRAIYGLRPLKWTTELADRAARWADQYKGDCAAASAAGSGVNVFRGYGGAKWQPSDAVAAWAEQAGRYNYGSSSCAPGQQCGGYKQMLWSASTEVGCASVPCASGETLMACHYV